MLNEKDISAYLAKGKSDLSEAENQIHAAQQEKTDLEARLRDVRKNISFWRSEAAKARRAIRSLNKSAENPKHLERRRELADAISNRYLLAAAMRADEKTYQEIADFFCVSVTRARALVEKGIRVSRKAIAKVRSKNER